MVEARQLGPEYIASGALVALRPWTRHDRRGLANWPPPNMPMAWLNAGDIEGHRTSYAIDSLPEVEAIGRITIRDVRDGGGRIGIYLRSDHLGYGYGTAALNLFQNWAFRSVGLLWLRLDVAVDNVRAVRCYEKCGWRELHRFDRAGVEFVEMERRAPGNVS